MKIANVFVACAFVALGGTASAQDDAKLGAVDAAFLKKAAQANLAEIEAGKLAQAKASRADIRSFGEKMVEDHGQTLRELQAIAQKKGVELPQAPDEAHQALADSLSRASGKEFDQIYIKNAGVADHKAARELFTSGTRSKDTEIRAFAEKTLPAIVHHGEMAQSLAKQ
jgi:putative membrane protein